MKAGRPRKYPEYEKAVSMLNPDVYSRMSKNNLIYQLIATKIIRDNVPELFPFFSRCNHPKASLLAELGRWEDKELILKFAREYTESKMTVADFIVGSRFLRMHPQIKE